MSSRRSIADRTAVEGAYRVTIIVNVSDARISADTGDVLATYSLGSCIAVAMYDPVACVGGLLHYQLPTSSLDPERAKVHPTMFADTGMELLLKGMAAFGAKKARLKVQIAGGAQMLNDASFFNIGKRNYAAIRKILWQAGMLIDREEVGGAAPRNVYLKVADGAITVKTVGVTAAA